MKLHYLLFCLIIIADISCISTKNKIKTKETEPIRRYELDQYHGPKKKVAVTKFINATRFGKRRLGDNIADILITELVKSNRFLLLEREHVDKILEQVALSQSGLTEGTLDEISMLDADYIITGKVTHYAVNTSGEKGFFTQTKTQTAEVATDVRLINVRTGEIVLSETGKGKAERVYEKVLGIGESGGYDESLEPKAFRKAVINLTEQIVNELDRYPWICDVVKISDSEIFIDAGRKSNISIGDKLDIYKKGEPVKNLSGKTLGYKEVYVGNGIVKEFIGDDGAVLLATNSDNLILPLTCKLK
jgi:curli biogenesis system outer membrane secretion channel CsgG